MPEQQPAQQASPLNLLRPLLLLSYSAFYLIPTIYESILSFNFKVFQSFENFKDAWFARFWTFFGPKSRQFAEPSVMPLLKNAARGVCLDIGPGSGEWLYLFGKANNGGITKIYGVEPNIGMHAQLRESAVKAGLGDIYEIVGCGAEELSSKGGIQKESIDTIITVQCLCSIPSPERIIKELYPLLKSGGKWLVYEHVRTKYQGDFVGYWQQGINQIWPTFFNGCDITRPTDEWLLQAGEWQEVKLRPGEGEGPYDTVPHVIGHLVKK
ncbi:hypothetical protein D0869_04530 [Hortaea werneckii]|uniref:Methyltransferase type 11 domain-containing protein n=1 Tax=Hortaea werneckii TaxID=91943 RepID=A0A3M6Y5J4_HORWE|nr:S-adenosyl-L-methionine-dependent methyltransferase [Hortaea werneckii]KAI7567730.1 S-adenosyl-L-methionine-dependent methyltransferase [Hortaea werneckii]RMX84499.1 hypothetical protein D0869_04530 [Hortaea werneckii]RMX98333.1 hypothetical protein D0868_10143 [Hortaea werneckii]